MVEMILFNLHVWISRAIVFVVITSSRYLKKLILKSLSNLDCIFFSFSPKDLQVLCGLVFPWYCVVVLSFTLVE